jgi:hypothetical protein
MTVSRDVILDLLPVYLAGEGSPATRELVEAFLKEDPELAQRVRLQWAENFRRIAPSTLPPELELKALSRTRALLGWQKWCFALAIMFTAFSLSFQFSFEHGRLTEFRPLLFVYPGTFGVCLGLAIALWAAYIAIRRRLRSSAL